jgi:diketogulonate reductase-like aldo/keto reductase
MKAGRSSTLRRLTSSRKLASGTCCRDAGIACSSRRRPSRPRSTPSSTFGPRSRQAYAASERTVSTFSIHGPENWVRPFGPTPFEEIGNALEALRREGKILHVGVCNLPVESLSALAEHVEIFSTQNLYSLIDRGIDPDELHLPVEGDIIPWARGAGVRFFAYSPLSRGLLSDNLSASRSFEPDDERYYLPRYQHGIYQEYVALAASIASWARERDRTVAQTAVAWTLNRDGVTSTLIGAKCPDHVYAMRGADSWEMTAEEMAELDDLVSKLSPAARAAKMVVWDHFDEKSLDWLRDRRYRTADVDAPWITTA